MIKNFLEKEELKPRWNKKTMLNNIGSLGKSSCAVYQIEVEIESFGEKKFHYY